MKLINDSHPARLRNGIEMYQEKDNVVELFTVFFVGSSSSFLEQCRLVFDYFGNVGTFCEVQRVDRGCLLRKGTVGNLKSRKLFDNFQ